MSSSEAQPDTRDYYQPQPTFWEEYGMLVFAVFGVGCVLVGLWLLLVVSISGYESAREGGDARAPYEEEVKNTVPPLEVPGVKQAPSTPPIPNCKPDEEVERLVTEAAEMLLKRPPAKKKGRKIKKTSIKDFGCRPLADRDGVSTQFIITTVAGVAATFIANAGWPYIQPLLPERDVKDTAEDEPLTIILKYEMIEQSPNIRPHTVQEAPCAEKRIEGSCLEKIKRESKPGTVERLKERYASGDGEQKLFIKWLLGEGEGAAIKCICVRGAIVAFHLPHQLRKTPH